MAGRAASGDAECPCTSAMLSRYDFIDEDIFTYFNARREGRAFERPLPLGHSPAAAGGIRLNRPDATTPAKRWCGEARRGPG